MDPQRRIIDRTHREKYDVLRATLGALILLFICATAAMAQEAPPLEVPDGGPPPRTELLTAGDWTLYPTMGFLSSYTNNLFQSPVNPLQAWDFEFDPSLVAEWNNGLRSTTIYGNANGRAYPSQSELNAFDDQVGIVQRFAPLRDFNFSFQLDYMHKTLATSLVNGIPGALASPASITLPNGNTVLPNGNIVNPSGQVVGQSAPNLTVGNSTTLINPYDQFTGTASVQKYLNGGVVSLTGAIARTDYENSLLNPNFTDETLGGAGAFSLGPMFYFFTNGSVAFYQTSSFLNTPSSNNNVYTVRGGIGTRQIGLFSASAYGGAQGSNLGSSGGVTTAASGSADGPIYGGRVFYYATPDWILSLGFDGVINRSSETGTTNLALNNPFPSALAIPISASTQLSSFSLQSSYNFNEQWSAFATFGYNIIQYLGSPGWENAWLADAVLRYELSRYWSITWEYQYSSIVSNIPLTSSTRNFISMGAVYKF